MNSYKNININNYRGYRQAHYPKSDEIISRIEPGTPCGEYLRRYWHPVALSSEVSTTPIEIRILGEDLVIFKTTESIIGPVHRNCLYKRDFGVYSWN